VILVDTDILIAHLRGAAPARDWLRQARQDGPLTVSVVTDAELSGGMRSAERHDGWTLLRSRRAEPATEIIARRAGEYVRQYRHSHSGIGLGDYLIAAPAQIIGANLATLNTRHFPMFPGLQPPFTLA